MAALAGRVLARFARCRFRNKLRSKVCWKVGIRCQVKFPSYVKDSTARAILKGPSLTLQDVRHVDRKITVFLVQSKSLSFLHSNLPKHFELKRMMVIRFPPAHFDESYDKSNDLIRRRQWKPNWGIFQISERLVEMLLSN